MKRQNDEASKRRAAIDASGEVLRVKVTCTEFYNKSVDGRRLQRLVAKSGHGPSDDVYGLPRARARSGESDVGLGIDRGIA